MCPKGRNQYWAANRAKRSVIMPFSDKIMNGYSDILFPRYCQLAQLSLSFYCDENQIRNLRNVPAFEFTIRNWFSLLRKRNENFIIAFKIKKCRNMTLVTFPRWFVCLSNSPVFIIPNDWLLTTSTSHQERIPSQFLCKRHQCSIHGWRNLDDGIWLQNEEKITQDEIPLSSLYKYIDISLGASQSMPLD